MISNQKILETLQMQPLSEADKANRHILGRLYGPIATCKESTRNGRKYNKDLWKKALNDEIFNEKVANKSLFLELGHPADREETDMEKVCACIPELPKIIDDDLYAYVDILDTKNGRILKTLCDYGFIPGISSRGSGDIMDNNEVDPETFFLETWDIVQLPAVKKARLTVCESVDQEALKLKQALVESYNNSTEEDKQIMKESLTNLHLADLLVESLDEEYVEDVTDSGTIVYIEEELDEDATTEDVEDTEEIEANITADEEADESTAENDEAEETDEVTAVSLKDVIAELQEYDQDKPVIFAPLMIDDKQIEITGLFVEENENNTVLGIGYTTADEAEDNIKDEESEEAVTVSADEESTKDAPAEDEAIDDEISEVMENLKEVVRQKNSLEEELNVLRQSKTVSDAKVKELTEQVTKYKESFGRMSELAAKAGELETANKTLSEELHQKNDTIVSLQKRAKENTIINENIDKDKAQIAKLTETINNIKVNAGKVENELKEECSQYKDKLAKTANIAKNYKAKYEAVLNCYIDSKAAALGVNKSEILSRLSENYSVKDVDNACDQLMDCTMNISRLPITRTPKVQIKESAQSSRRINDPNDGYEIDDDLLILAGLK